MAATGSREPAAVGTCPSQFIAHRVFRLCLCLRFPWMDRIDWWTHRRTFILLTYFIGRRRSFGSFSLRRSGVAVRDFRSSLWQVPMDGGTTRRVEDCGIVGRAVWVFSEPTSTRLLPRLFRLPPSQFKTRTL